MATIIRAADAPHTTHVAPLNLNDIAAELDQQLASARSEAARVVTEAHDQADSIRRQTVEAAVHEVEQMVAERLAPALSALEQAVAQLTQARQAWLSHWETAAVRLAAAMAARVARRQIEKQPEVTLALVREALELAAGSPNVRLQLNPEDHRVLGAQVRTLTAAMSSLGAAEVVPDAAISQGGCRVETRFGAIDQQIESQLKRIEEELLH